jgi:hypothetical protein
MALTGSFIDIGKTLYVPPGGKLLVTRKDGGWTDKFIQYYIDQECPGMPFEIGVKFLKDIAARTNGKSGGSQFTKYSLEVSAYYVLLLRELDDIYKNCGGLVSYADLYRLWQDSLLLYGFGERVLNISTGARLLVDSVGGLSKSNYKEVYDSNLGDTKLVSSSSGSSGYGNIKLYGGIALGLIIIILIIR